MKLVTFGCPRCCKNLGTVEVCRADIAIKCPYCGCSCGIEIYPNGKIEYLHSEEIFFGKPIETEEIKHEIDVQLPMPLEDEEKLLTLGMNKRK